MSTEQHTKRMRLPVRMNDHFWPLFLNRFKSRIVRLDPRILIPEPPRERVVHPDWYGDAISLFKFGSTYKSTFLDRHINSDALWLDTCEKDAIILDIGASDGGTSLRLMEKLGDKFQCYFVTDYNLYAYYQQSGKRTYFYDQSGQGILIATPMWVIYPQESERWKRNLASQGRLFVENVASMPRVELIHHLLKHKVSTDQRIKVQPYNIFEPWTGPQPTHIKVGNLLNTKYFAVPMIKKALQNIHSTLPIGGFYLHIENRNKERLEKGALFQKQQKGWNLVRNYGPPVDILDLILSI